MTPQVWPALYGEAGLSFLWEYLTAHQGVAGTPDSKSIDFLSYCLARFTRSKAQLFQDLYVTYKLGDKRNGFFVEFGATDGVMLSNTYSLEQDLGWSGILAEPYPVWRESLRANRGKARIDFRCVWKESGKQLEFLAARKFPELASLTQFAAGDQNTANRLADAETIIVETISLNDLLVEHRAPEMIDYLSVDTEGSEFEILNSFDFERFKARIVTVEHNYRPEIRESLRNLLQAKGFVREFEVFSRWDDWYFHPQRVADARAPSP